MASQILITGATGFIGRHLTRDLVSAGNAVRVLARDPEKARSLFGDMVEVSTGDLLDLSSLRQACVNVDIVYHIAGIYRFGLRHRQNIHQTNIEGTENLLEASATTHVGKIIHVSSASVLGKPKGFADHQAVLDGNRFSCGSSPFFPL